MNSSRARRRDLRRNAGLSQAAVVLAWVALLGFFLGACGCKGSARPSRGARDLPDIVLVTVDALRPDHLSLYGYERKTSPRLEALAADGLVFRAAYSTAPWTAPAMASLFTSLYPLEHGVRKGVFSPGEMHVVQQEALSPRLPTLAGWLKEKGYLTIGIATNPHTSRDLGFARGFDRWREHGVLIEVGRELREVQDAAARDEKMREKVGVILDDPLRVNELALAEVGAAPPGRPFFLWVHYMNVHWPYLPREPWFAEYFGGEPPPDTIALYRDYLPATPERIGIEKGGGTFRFLVAAYDSQVRFSDEVVHGLLERLPRPDRTAVVFTADHGEEFLEHGGLFHGSSLYDEEIRVPLVVRLPEPHRRHAVVDRLASAIDVVPTIQALVAGKPEPWAGGESLLDAGSAGEMDPTPAAPAPERAVLAELGRAEKSLMMIRTPRWKLVFDSKRLKQELYDMAADPGEAMDLGPKEQALRLQLFDALNEARSRLRRGEPTVVTRRLDQAEIEALRALGYAAGGGTASAGRPPGP